MQLATTAVIAITILASTCLTSPSTDQAAAVSEPPLPMRAPPWPAGAAIDVLNLTHEMLMEGRITLEPERGAWVAIRLVSTPALWGPQDWTQGLALLRFAIVLEVEDDAEG